MREGGEGGRGFEGVDREGDAEAGSRRGRREGG